MSEPQADIALIGLAVMGQNLVMNMADHGFTVAVYNRTTSVTKEFVAGTAKDASVIGCETLEEMVATLKPPRRVMMLVKAGGPVDAVIDQLTPLLDKGDIIIDGGNSHFPDTQRRWEACKAKGLRFIGTGVSGGEEGARHGPSIMPGGEPDAWPFVKDIFQSVSAKSGGEPCCDWVGSGGAGHYVKMVHNGIEYGDMQLICEAYQILREGLGLSNQELHQVFTKWNEEELDSYLIEITRDIFGYTEEDGTHTVDLILDKAGQKGTGKWTGISALDLGMPVTLIGESVFARCLSALKDERTAAAKILSGPDGKIAAADRDAFIEDVKQALYASKIVSYAQGYMLLREATKEHGWDLNFGGIALMWRGGCIIRSRFLGDIKAAFDKNPELSNLLVDDFFKKAIDKAQGGWRRVVAAATTAGIPIPTFSTALSFYDGYRRERLPANLLQAQRDYFGAHTYERTDKPAGEWFHTNWTGRGGNTTSRTYNA
ncbi:MAG: decarboxylating NADP(+)-dependent phosphogluconate dehydrogenase [Planctomycetota bacterium]|jgi:6-phosphogluconate dehydrogenase|nr:decarboxylating NADP(+)-dependent phosphogluconate dehydrogenase [Planctomycetota bacterium]